MSVIEESKQIHKAEPIAVRLDTRTLQLADEQRRADLMNLSLLIRRYPAKAKEFMRKFRLTEPQDVV
jgi:hypothetical protein